MMLKTLSFVHNDLFVSLMNEKNVDEIRYRRLAFRLFDQGKSAAAILKRVPRSRTWLFKWKKRFEQKRWRALDSLSRAPKRSAKRYDRRWSSWCCACATACSARRWG